MTKEEKIIRGKHIIEDYTAAVRGWYGSAAKKKTNPKPESFDYYEEILHAISEYTHETPITKEDMYIALAEAEEQGKRVSIEPDPQFLPNEDGKIKDSRDDGWSYHIVIS